MSETNSTPAQYRVPEDCPSIQAAIDAIPKDGTGVINVGSGTFPSCLLIENKTVFLNGYSEQKTILDGEGKHPVCRVLGGNLHIQNVTIRNGKNLQGGGLLIIDSVVSIKHTTIQMNNADYGGGFYASKSHVHLKDVNLMNNTAYNGGGFRSGESFVEATRTSIQENYATFGSGAYCWRTYLTLCAVSVAGNGSLEREDMWTPVEGMWASDAISIPYCREGGGLWMFSTEYTFDKVRIADNIAAKGGGWYSESSRANGVTNLCVQDNFTDQCYNHGERKGKQ